jgi:hypothetical protein
VVPQTLTGNLTYHWESSSNYTVQSGKTDTNSYTLDIQLTNIQMQLDGMPNAAGEAQYVVKSAQVSVKGGGSDTLTFSPPFPTCQEVTQTQFVADPNGASKRDGKLTIDLPVSAGGALCGDNAILGWGEWVIESNTWVNGCATGGVVPSGGGMYPPAEWYIPRGTGLGSIPRGTERVVGSAVRVQFDKSKNTWSGSDSTGTATEWLQASFMSADAGALDKLELIDVDIGGNLVSDDRKQSVGGLVVKHITAQEDPNGEDNMAPRLRIHLDQLMDASGNPFPGTVVLDPPAYDAAAAPAADGVGGTTPGIGVYKQASGGQPLTFRRDSKFDNAKQLPMDLWVEGASGSDHMRDVTLNVWLLGAADCVKDSVKLTVLDVETPTIRWGADEVISSDNNKRAAWINNLGEATDKLGPQAVIFQATMTAPGGGNKTVTEVDMGWALEGRAAVHPSDFRYPNLPPGVPANLPVVLDRDAELHAWLDDGLPPGIPNYQPDLFSDKDKIPPGNDGWWTGDAFSDVSPRPNGVIYNLDKPGPNYFGPQPYGLTDRTRYSFKIFADVQIEPGKWVRCSPITRYSILQSWVQLSMPSGYTWQLLTKQNAPPGITVVDGDNNVYLGDAWFNRWTWDLQPGGP